MRTIYPKLITALFVILLAALVARYVDSPGSSSDRSSAQQLGYNPQK